MRKMGSEESGLAEGGRLARLVSSCGGASRAKRRPRPVHLALAVAGERERDSERDRETERLTERQTREEEAGHRQGAVGEEYQWRSGQGLAEKHASKKLGSWDGVVEPQGGGSKTGREKDAGMAR